MDLTVKSAIEAVLKRFNDFNAKWEAKFASVESMRLECVASSDRRFAVLEQTCAGLPAVQSCVAVLEEFCSEQSEQNVVADEWGRSIDRRVGELEQRTDDLKLIRINEICDELDDRVSALEGAAEVFEEWRPWVEASIHDIRLEIKRFAKPDPSSSCPQKVSASSARPAVVSSGTWIDPEWGAPKTAHAGAEHFPEMASARPSAKAKAVWPSGHHVQGYGSVTTVTPPQGFGKTHLPLPSHPPQFHTQPYPVHPPHPPDPSHPHHGHLNQHNSHPTYYHSPPSYPTQQQFIPHHHHTIHPTQPDDTTDPSLAFVPVSYTHQQQLHPTHLGRLPKLDFPKFDGDHAQFWITCAMNYFEMYAVEPFMWVRVATMHFTGPAKRWLQSIEHLLLTTDWKTFCSKIHERFSRDQHKLLLCQLFNIRQTGSVSEYVDKFTELIDQLKSYNLNPDLLTYTTRFVDGLRDDIRAVILVARPTSLDSAYTLALLQEEVGGTSRTNEHRKPDQHHF